MIIDPQVHRVQVRRVPGSNTAVQDGPGRQRYQQASTRDEAARRPGLGPLEETAWAEVLAGRRSLIDYWAICDKIEQLGRK